MTDRRAQLMRLAIVVAIATTAVTVAAINQNGGKTQTAEMQEKNR